MKKLLSLINFKIHIKSGGKKISLIKVENLNFGYKNQDILFRNISFQIKEGEIVGLVGDNGSGKTTLGYILKGIIPHMVKGNLIGSIYVDNLDVPKTKISKLARIIGMVFQNLDMQMFNTSVREEINFGLRNLDLNLDWGEETMNLLNVKHLADKLPMNLSAGEKQKVSIASILAMRPKILIFDEPSTHLDFKSRNDFIDLLKKIHRQYNTTIIIIEQDPWILGMSCQYLFTLENKQLNRCLIEDLLEQNFTWCWKKNI